MWGSSGGFDYKKWEIGSSFLILRQKKELEVKGDIPEQRQ